MNSFIKNKKLIVIISILILGFFFIIAFLTFNKGSKKDTQNNPRPTPFNQSETSKVNLNKGWVKLPVSEDDPRLWVDENGNTIESDNSNE